jgi:hypothetical protein|tara:strand:- start:333 stop:482 length:150 start_codon:yes stop_codon:yes gene_type:complete
MELKVKLFADGADKADMLEMYNNPLSKNALYQFISTYKLFKKFNWKLSR